MAERALLLPPFKARSVSLCAVFMNFNQNICKPKHRRPALASVCSRGFRLTRLHFLSSFCLTWLTLREKSSAVWPLCSTGSDISPAHNSDEGDDDGESCDSEDRIMLVPQINKMLLSRIVKFRRRGTSGRDGNGWADEKTSERDDVG